MKKFLKSERGDIGVAGLTIVIFMSMVVATALFVFTLINKAETEDKVYNGVSATLSDLVETGSPTSDVNAEMLNLVMKKMKNADAETVKNPITYGANVKTLTFKKGDKIATYEVYADHDAMYLVGDGTGVLKGLDGKKALRFTGFDRNDMETYVNTEGFVSKTLDMFF